MDRVGVIQWTAMMKELWICTHRDRLGWEPWLLKQCLRGLEQHCNTVKVRLVWLTEPEHTESDLDIEHIDHRDIATALSNGWLTQQKIKLTSWRFTDQDHIVWIDTKNILRDSAGDFHQPRVWPQSHWGCYEHYAKLWNLDFKPVKRNITPWTVDAAVARTLCEELGDVDAAISREYRTRPDLYRSMGIRPTESLRSGGFSEFTVLSLYEQRIGLEPEPDTVREITEQIVDPRRRIKDRRPWLSIHRRELARWFGTDQERAQQWLESVKK